MDNIAQLDSYFKNYIKNIHSLLPEGIIDVDLKLMQKYELLDYYVKNNKNSSLTRYFHVIETTEKITLINDQFVVWIVPEKINNVPVTYTLIALNKEHIPQLEMAFMASGCYNSSRLVLRILDIFLQEIQENEDLLKNFLKSS